MSTPISSCYVLPRSLQLEWLAITGHQEWAAGLKLDGNTISWFDLRFGSRQEVEFISIKREPRAIGTVHYHPHEHNIAPIPSLSDGLNWIYVSYWEISDNLNPIFFIVFKDQYASWAMFPKPPIVRKKWLEEFERLGKRVEVEEEVSWNTCLRLLKEDLIKTGLFRLGQDDKIFTTF